MLKQLLRKTRIIILVLALFISILAIAPNPSAKGIVIKSVEPGSIAASHGIKEGEVIESINGKEISTLLGYREAVKELESEPVKVSIRTDNGIFSYNVTESIGFLVDENLTVIISDTIVPRNSSILEINDRKVGNITEFNSVLDELIPEKKIIINTDKAQYAYLSRTLPEISVKNAETTNLVKGLDLQGGARVLLKPSEKVTEQEISDIIDVMSNRLNVFGLKDINIRSTSDLERNRFILVEVAGATQEDVKELVAKQGKFEAKIGDKVVFRGESRDIPFVCRNDGTCSRIKHCQDLENTWACTYEFQVRLSQDAAKRHAEATKDLEVIKQENSFNYLEKQLDFYLDDKLVNSLNIAADLKGQEATAIAISGSGFGANEKAASKSASDDMNRLQTVLITGSLPVKLETVKLDTISPLLGSNFIKNAFLVVIATIIAVALVLFIRYKRFIIVVPIIITLISEIVMTLGIAALIKWNLDLVSIAGIVAAVGTGVDDQIVIIDEMLKGEERYIDWKQRIKRAFSIIMAAYATTVAAMLPLWSAGAGLIRGFAVITIIGVTVGVLITRPAFASMIEILLKKQ